MGRTPLFRVAISALLAAGVFLASAPAKAVNPTDIAVMRGRLRLSASPGAHQEVLALQQKLVAERQQAEASKTREVVLIGQIGGMPNVWPQTHPHFPWYAGQASFFLVDSKVAAQFASHAKAHGGEDCAFCRQLASQSAAAVAVVNIVDAQGKIIEVDARELLGVKERQTVIVRGRARLLAGTLLIVDADGIFVPR